MDERASGMDSRAVAAWSDGLRMASRADVMLVG